jgi:hypothetical protein
LHRCQEKNVVRVEKSSTIFRTTILVTLKKMRPSINRSDAHVNFYELKMPPHLQILRALWHRAPK